MDGLHVVLGAGGGTGAALVDALLERGLAVRAVGRRELPERRGVQVVAADLTDPAQALRAVNGAAVVFHAAQPAYNRWPEDFPPINRPVIDAVAAAGAKLVVADNLYMYGPYEPQADGAVLREDTPQRATDRKGAFRAAMAAELLAAHEAGRVRVTLGRSANYFGPHGTVTTLLGDPVFGAAVARSPVTWFGDPTVPRTGHYLPDIAAGLLTLADDERADGRAWHLPAAPAVTGEQFTRLLQTAVGSPLGLQALDLATVKALGAENPFMTEIADIWHQYDRPFVSDDSAFQATFGPQPATPLPDAIAATVAWFRARPQT